MKNKDFLSFLLQSEVPPLALKEAGRKDIRLSFRKKEIIFKFLSFQLLGILISLTFCPQFGLGFVSGHGIAHVFRLMGDWACAAFCGLLFLSSGMLTAFIGMKGEELWWIWRRYKISLIFLPVIFWGLLMLMNRMFDRPSETFDYHLVWLAATIMAQQLWLSLRSGLYALRGPLHQS